MGFRATCVCGLHSSVWIFRSHLVEGQGAEAHVELGVRIMRKLFGTELAEFYKLCGIRENQEFSRRRG